MVAMMVTYKTKKKETKKQEETLKKVEACLKHWGVLKEKTNEKMGRGNMTKVTSQKEWVINGSLQLETNPTTPNGY